MTFIRELDDAEGRIPQADATFRWLRVPPESSTSTDGALRWVLTVTERDPRKPQGATVNNDFVNKALESARSLQQTVADAMTKGAEQAKPLRRRCGGQGARTAKDASSSRRRESRRGAPKRHLQTAQGHLNDVHHHGARTSSAKGAAGAQAEPDPAGRERPAGRSSGGESRYRGDGTETAGSAGKLARLDRQSRREMHEARRRGGQSVSNASARGEPVAARCSSSSA